jgi:hypothetical protein
MSSWRCEALVPLAYLTSEQPGNPDWAALPENTQGADPLTDADSRGYLGTANDPATRYNMHARESVSGKVADAKARCKLFWQVLYRC